MRTVTLLSLLVMLASCGQPYQPCETVDDCDPEVTDGCAVEPTAGLNICTLVCQTASDCPEGPDGEQPACLPFDGKRICVLPVT